MLYKNISLNCLRRHDFYNLVYILHYFYVALTLLCFKVFLYSVTMWLELLPFFRLIIIALFNIRLCVIKLGKHNYSEIGVLKFRELWKPLLVTRNLTIRDLHFYIALHYSDFIFLCTSLYALIFFYIFIYYFYDLVLDISL